VSNQDIEGSVPADAAPAAPPGTPEYFEQQLTKEREARALMRDRLRHTEALAAESHALRARMAEELERVTADRNRLRTAAESAPAATAASAADPLAHGDTVPIPGIARAPVDAPPMTPHLADAPLKPPTPRARRGPWRALGMLGALAAAVGVVAWITGTVPGLPDAGVRAARDTPAAPLASPAPVARAAPPAASTVIAAVPAPAPAPAAVPSGAVALPPLAPEAQLAAAPTAAGPTPAPAPAGMAARLRKALDGEGIAAPVDIDAASGHVIVADPKADLALRDRTDMLIRAVYAGASMSEPQIEHRWLSPMRAAQAGSAAPAVAPPPPGPAPAPAPAMTAAQAYAARHAAHAAEARAARATGPTVADVEELRPVLPEGRVTASCRAGLAGRTAHRTEMTACMKTSCCRPGAGQSEECRAYQKAYPFTCGAG